MHAAGQAQDLPSCAATAAWVTQPGWAVHLCLRACLGDKFMLPQKLLLIMMMSTAQPTPA
jgi:hypothetical protein